MTDSDECSVQSVGSNQKKCVCVCGGGGGGADLE